MDDIFAELNAEIATAIAKDNRLKEAERLRKASNNRFATKEQRITSKAEYEKLRAELEAATWFTEAYYAMFSEQICDGCGSVHRTFLQYMALQHSAKSRSAQRFTPVGKPNTEAPRRVMIQPLKTHICADCCGEHSFSFEQVETVLRHNGVITVPKNYQQEDINDAES